ncbi:MAG: tRNA lysidine(34) synthetase TilS [Candidatus Marinimicrobia bacterium]|jgi:tRNA(Ile)-lysidine synthase|nr:tRNA lysidine(34) synthetase TilS [Candidatus Neomarinimicrobiota bacterium]MDP6499629.1 tRNA lysidine(34) synthetase TilS [Candidatus Neomarinimicrobiota bacterium]MDP6725776.1 tRNA lysidine(34) synthetase TilS [Candidatus Neomarinimicrobiota bacterium]|tara:strand:+ start:83 stop:1456 length:1374 start_codon:yes stop_codon:yes gene_type:complete
MKNPKLNQFEKSLVGYLCSQSRIKSDQRVIIAVSGGKDSMVLLHSMNKTARRLNIAIDAVHVNHHLRDDSYEDQALVEKTCVKLKINLIIDHLDPATKLKGESLEMWARTHRYRSLERIRKEINADWIFTAHHGNDQIETILLHLSQGTGISGFRGIHDIQGHILRPLLGFSRVDIDQYADEVNISWVDDSSNADETIPRNYLRRNIVKLWEKSDPNLVKAFQEVSEHAKDANEALKFAANIFIPNIIKQKTRVFITLDEVQLLAIPPLLRIILLRELMDSAEPWRRFVYSGLKRFFKNANTGQIYQLPDEWQILKDRKQFILTRKNLRNRKPITVSPRIKIETDDFIFIWKTDCIGKSFNSDRETEIIDANKINQTMILRPWEPGDRFQPLGMSGHKKVSDFLIDIKMDRFSKQEQFVLADKEEVLWVCGQRISDRVKVTPETTDYAELSFRQDVV